MKPILNHFILGIDFPSGRDGAPSRPSVGAGGDRADVSPYSVGADGGRAFKQARRLLYIKKSPPSEGCRDGAVPRSELRSAAVGVGSVGAIRDRALVNVRAHGTRLQGTSVLRLPSSDLRLPSRLAARAGFSMIEVMVSVVLGAIVVIAAGSQIINVLRYHNEYRIDAILLEDVSRVASDVQGRIEMCTSWTTNNNGVWEGTFPIQINGVAFETNRFTNVKQYQIVATNGAFVETLIRNPKEGLVTNTVNRFIANEPGFLWREVYVNFEKDPVMHFPDISISMPVSNLVKAKFSVAAEWRWAGRTYTNRVTVPRIIVLYNKN